MSLLVVEVAYGADASVAVVVLAAARVYAVALFATIVRETVVVTVDAIVVGVVVAIADVVVASGVAASAGGVVVIIVATNASDGDVDPSIARLDVVASVGDVVVGDSVDVLLYIPILGYCDVLGLHPRWKSRAPSHRYY